MKQKSKQPHLRVYRQIAMRELGGEAEKDV